MSWSELLDDPSLTAALLLFARGPNDFLGIVLGVGESETPVVFQGAVSWFIAWNPVDLRLGFDRPWLEDSRILRT